MKRLLIGLTIATMGLALGAPQVSAQPNASQFCSANGDFGLSHGACVSLVTAENPTAAISDLCKDPGFRDFVSTVFGSGGELNHGQCVKLVKSLI